MFVYTDVSEKRHDFIANFTVLNSVASNGHYALCSAAVPNRCLASAVTSECTDARVAQFAAIDNYIVIGDFPLEFVALHRFVGFIHVEGDFGGSGEWEVRGHVVTGGVHELQLRTHPPALKITDHMDGRHRRRGGDVSPFELL